MKEIGYLIVEPIKRKTLAWYSFLENFEVIFNYSAYLSSTTCKYMLVLPEI